MFCFFKIFSFIIHKTKIVKNPPTTNKIIPNARQWAWLLYELNRQILNVAADFDHDPALFDQPLRDFGLGHLNRLSMCSMKED